jgi:hypothetical protein
MRPLDSTSDNADNAETEGQRRYEWRHLRSKFSARCPCGFAGNHNRFLGSPFNTPNWLTAKPAACMKTYWTEALDRLKEMLDG